MELLSGCDAGTAHAHQVELSISDSCASSWFGLENAADISITDVSLVCPLACHVFAHLMRLQTEPVVKETLRPADHDLVCLSLRGNYRVVSCFRNPSRVYHEVKYPVGLIDIDL